MGCLARFRRGKDVRRTTTGKEAQAMNAPTAPGWKFKFLFRALTILGLIAVLPACGGGGGGDDGDGGGGGSDTFWSGTTPTGTPVFVSRYVYGDFGGANSVLENPDHSFLFAGSRFPAVGPGRIHIAKTDANGGVLWEKSYLSPDNNGTFANSVRRTADGGYIVAGEATYASVLCFYLLKTDANGNTQWSRPYAGAVPGHNGFRSVVQTADGGYAAVGSKINPAGRGYDVYLAKTDAQGLVQEERYFGGNGPDYGSAVQPTRDGGFVIAGEYDAGGPGNGIYLVKTDAARNEVWSRAYGHGRVFAVVQAPDDGFVLTGDLVNAAGNKDLFVMKTTAAGDVVATKTFGGAKDDEGVDIATTQDGGYVVVGSTYSYSSGSNPAAAPWQTQDVFLIRLTANLDTVWQVVKGRAPDSGDVGNAVIETSDNNYLVGGTLGGGIILAKFDRNGVTATLGETDFTFRPTATAGTVNMSNAAEAAGAGATSFDIVRTIGPFGLDLLVGVLGGDTPADFCTAGGTYSSTLTPGPSVGAGSVFTVTFQNCVANLGGNVTFNGTYAMTFDNVTGTFPGASFAVDTRVHLDNLVFTDDVGSTGLQGGLRFRRAATATDNTDQSDSLPATSLVYSTDGIILQIGPFAVQSAETATLLTLGPASATIVHSGIGTLQASTTATISGASSMAPDSGAFVTRATDNSSVTATVSPGGNVSLAVDTDGNGTVDGTQTTTWDDMLF
jgi:hypothetical protein